MPVTALVSKCYEQGHAEKFDVQVTVHRDKFL